MSDREVSVGIVADTSALVPGVEKAKRSLKDLGQAATDVGKGAETAGKSIATMGDGGAQAAQKIDGASRSIIAAIQRATAAAESGGKSTAKYYETIAAQRGIGADVLRPYLDQLDAARKKQDEVVIGLSGVGAAMRATGALAAAGIFASFTKSIFEASVTAERLKIALNFASAGQGQQELAYVTTLSNKLGLSLQSTAAAYTGFAAAARGTALEGAQTKSIFEAVSRASAVMGLSAEQSSGALLALQQMISKGSVQAEELRGQLGERLPGAFQIAARSMGVTTQELGKMLEAGQVLASDFLPKFARQLEAELGGAAEAAGGRLGAATNRMETALFRLKTALGNTGLAAAVAGGISNKSTFINFIAEDVEKFNSSGALRTAAREVIDLRNQSVELQRALERGGLLPPGVAAQLDLVNGKLEVAKKNFRDLDAQRRNAAAPPDVRSQYPGQGSHAAYDAEQAEAQKKAEQDLMEVRRRLAGVDENYLKDLGKLQAARVANILSEREYISAVSTLATETYKKSEAGKVAAKYEKESASAAKTAAEQYKDIILSLDKRIALSGAELNAGRQLTASEKEHAQVATFLESAKSKLTDTQRAAIEAKLKEAEAGDVLVAVQRSEEAQIAQLAKVRRELKATDYEQSAAALRDIENASAAALASVKQRVQDMEDEQQAAALAAGSNISLAEAIERVAIARLKDKQSRLIEGSPEYEAVGKEIEERLKLANLTAAKAAREDWESTWKSVSESFVDNLMRGGKSVAEYLKDLFRTLVLKPILSPIGQAVGGISAGLFSGAAAAQSVGGAGSAIGATLGSLFGAGGLSGSLAAGAGWLTGATTLSGSLSAGASLVGAGGAGILPGLGMMAGALGPIALAAMAAYSLFGGQGGGPKNIGSFSTNNSLYDATRTDTTAASNQAAQTVAQGIVDSYTQAVAALGIKGGKLDAAVLTSVDDKGAGNAMTALVTQAFLNGQRIYDRENAASGSDAYKNVGRSPEELQAAITESAADALLSALKASDLTPKLSEYFDKLDPLELNADQIQKAIAAAQSAQALFTVLGNLGPAFKSVADLSVEAINSLAKAYNTDPSKFATDLQSFYTNFTPAGEQRNNAVNSVVAGLNAAGINVTFDQVANATAEQVNSLMQSMIAMGSAGQQGAFALLQFGSTIKQIIDTASRAPTAAEVAQNALNVRTPGFLTDEERSQIVGGNIQSKLAAAGVNVSISDILGADAATVSNFYHSLQASGNTSGAQVVVDFADSLLGLKSPAEQVTHTLGGVAAGFDEALARMQRNIAAQAEFDRQLANIPAPGQGSIDRATAQLADLKSQLQTAYQAESATLKQTVQAHLSAADSLKAARIALDTGAQSGLNGQERYAAAKDALRFATPENASGLVSTYLDAAKNNARTSIDYLRAVASGRNLLSGLENKERDAASVAQRQVDAMAALIDPLVGVQKSVYALLDAYKQAELRLDLANLGQQSYYMSQSGAAQLFDDYFAGLLQKYGGTEEGLSAALYGRGLSAESLQAYLRTLPGYAVGTSFVPETGPAILHRGEAVIPAALNGSGQSNDALIEEVRALRAQVAVMSEHAKTTGDNTERTRKLLQQVCLGNASLATRAE